MPKKKRKPPAAPEASRRSRTRTGTGAGTPPAPPPRRALHYKVVELSHVDEHALQRTLNEWAPQGWVFDGVQFAMRESSKRPSMAFVFFTREGDALPEPVAAAEPFRPDDEAHAHLKRLTAGARHEPVQASPDAWARLQQLALEGDDE